MVDVGIAKFIKAANVTTKRFAGAFKDFAHTALCAAPAKYGWHQSAACYTLGKGLKRIPR